MSGIEYTTLKDASYFFNQKKITRNNQTIKRAVYLPDAQAIKLYRLCKTQKTTPPDHIFEKGHFNQKGGRIIYQTTQGKYIWSSQIKSRKPNFPEKSLDEKLDKE